jgi:DNA-binding GntR family transcriptional regulator
MEIGVPAYEQLRDLLREEIISGSIPPDTHLTILGVAKRFGVSHMPVREAFQWLQGEGLMKLQAHRGARVLSLTSDYVRDIYELRGIMAGLLARQSISYFTPESLAMLDHIHKQFCKAAKKEDLDKLLSSNHSFHNNIYMLGRNHEAKKTYKLYAGLLGTLRRRYGIQPPRLKKMIEEHSKILEALHAGDGNRVEKLVRLHGDGAMNDILFRMEREAQAGSMEKSGSDV